MGESTPEYTISWEDHNTGHWSCHWRYQHDGIDAWGSARSERRARRAMHRAVRRIRRDRRRLARG